MLHVAFIRGFMIKIYQTSMFKLGLLCLTVDAFFFIHRAWKLSRNCLITDMFLTVCCIFRATAGLRCCWCDRYPRSDSAAVWSSSPGFSGGCFWKQVSGDHTGRGNQGKHVWQTQPTTADVAFHLPQIQHGGERKGKLWIRRVRWVYFTGFSATYDDEFMVLSKDMHSFVKHR